MSMSKHTPGPWGEMTMSSNNLTIGIGYPEGDDRDHFLAEVTCGDPDELEANARLIAAAPQMLQALQALVLGMQYLHGNKADNATAKARAAIAAATGEPA